MNKKTTIMYTWYKNDTTIYAFSKGYAYEFAAKTGKFLKKSGHYDPGEFKQRHKDAVLITKPANADELLNSI